MKEFSWITSDTNRSISIRRCFPVYVLIPEEFGGGYLMEDNYDGYGVFGGRDVYALVAQWNCPEKCKGANGEWLPDKDVRGLGIDIACYDEQNAALRYPIKIVEDKTIKYKDAAPSMSCPYQGYFYPEFDDDFWDTDDDY